MATLFMLLSSIALLLAVLGLYAVMAHAVSERVREVGTRTALGATAADVLRLILKQGAGRVTIGLAGGVAGSLLLGAVLRTRMAQLTPSDPAMLMGAVVLLVLAVVAGCVVPARRALRVDPILALRSPE